MNFKDEYNLESRKIQSKEALDKYYPYKVPVVIQRHLKNNELVPLKRRKYLIPCSMKYSALMVILRQKILEKEKLPPSIALFLFTESGNILCNTDNILNIYQQHHDREDGFLYLYYCSENTFG
jgi:hypothetical protein